MHPMKGPMTARNLRGLDGINRFHWRGDRADLMPSAAAFELVDGLIDTAGRRHGRVHGVHQHVRFMPIRIRISIRSLPRRSREEIRLRDRIPSSMILSFRRSPATPATRIDPGPGTSNAPSVRDGALQPFKVAHLRNRLPEGRRQPGTGRGVSVNGFGLLNDGSAQRVRAAVAAAVSSVRVRPVRKSNLSAFLMCFDTGMAPAVGYARTLDP